MGKFWRENIVEWTLGLASLLCIVYFYCLHRVYHPQYGATAFQWLLQTWTPTNELAHGIFVPFIIFYLTWKERKTFKLDETDGAWGLILVVVGVLVYWASVRTMQQRLMVGSLPIILWGGMLHLCGWSAMKRLLIPFGLLYFVIPMPGMTQATNGLQLLATKGAFEAAQLFGAEVSMEGNFIRSIGEKEWGFDVAEGCSGIRSLMAMGLVAAVYAHLTEQSWWKKGTLLLCSIPLAIFANVLRVSSIVLIAEYGSAEFAANLYHDYSSFIFFPCALAGLVLTSQILNFSKHFGSKVVRVSRTGDPSSS